MCTRAHTCTYHTHAHTTHRGENDRDNFNEKPSKEEQLGATQVSTVKGQNSQAYELFYYKLVTYFFLTSNGGGYVGHRSEEVVCRDQ